MAVYSFINYVGAFGGPGGSFSMGYGDAIAEEGVKTSMLDDKDLATFGADGALMHTLRAANGGKAEYSLLKTSILNARLSQAYNFQKNNPQIWGQNNISGGDIVRGDNFTLKQAAFIKYPDNVWDKDGKMIVWTFVGILNEMLGTGVPDVNN